MEEGLSLAQAKTHCFHQMVLRKHYKGCDAYLHTAVNSKTIASRQRSGKRTISSVTTADDKKKMTSCNGVSLKNVDRRFGRDEWSKLSPEAKEYLRKNRKLFTKRRRVSYLAATDSPEPQHPAPPTPVRQARMISAVTSSSRRSVYRVSKLHSSPGPVISVHTTTCEIDNHADTYCLG